MTFLSSLGKNNFNILTRVTFCDKIYLWEIGEWSNGYDKAL